MNRSMHTECLACVVSRSIERVFFNIDTVRSWSAHVLWTLKQKTPQILESHSKIMLKGSGSDNNQ